MENLNDTIISIDGVSDITIIVSDEGKQIIDNDILTWHEEDNGMVRSLTLEEIYKQLTKLGYKGVISVWDESPLYGVIYQCGNYSETRSAWLEHGTTRGYA